MALCTLKPRAGKTYFYEIWPPRNNVQCTVFLKILHDEKTTLINIHTEEIHIILCTCVEICYGLPIKNFHDELGTNLKKCEQIFFQLKTFYYQIPLLQSQKRCREDLNFPLHVEDLQLILKMMRRAWQHFGWDHPDLPVRFDCSHEDFFDVMVCAEEWFKHLQKNS